MNYDDKNCMLCTVIFVFMSAAALGIASVAAAVPLFYGNCNEGVVLFGAACYLVLVFGIFQISRKLSEKVLLIVLIFGMSAAAAFHIWIAFSMKLVPKVDLSHIYEECVRMVKIEHPEITDKAYFGFYTNNIPVTIVIYLFFRLSTFLGGDYRLAGGLLNTFMLLMVYVFSYKILRRITSMRVAFIVMFILLTNPAFYAYTSYYYTDTVSMGFMMPGTWYLLTGMQKKSGKSYYLRILLAGFLIGLATGIRVTSIFIFLAVIVFLIIQKRAKELLRLLVTFLTGLIIFILLWGRIYAHYVDFPTTESAVPITHFFMMGSHGNGTYDQDDVLFTRGFDTHREKVENTTEVWVQNLKKNGFSGNLRLVFIKEGIVWGIGDRGYRQYTEYVENETLCYRLLRGNLSFVFQNYMQSYNIILFILISLGFAAAAKEKRKDYLVLAVYWGGAIVFYIFWEAHPRQSLSYLPLLSLMIIPRIERMMNTIK